MTLPTSYRPQPGADAAQKPGLLDREHSALLMQYGQVQRRCTEALATQAQRIGVLEAELVRLRAIRIIQDTMLAQQRDAHEALATAKPGLPRRSALAHQADALLERVTDLVAKRQGPAPPTVQQAKKSDYRPIFWSQPAQCRTSGQPDGRHILHLDGSVVEDETALESSLAAADLVICQVACISHNAFWRVQEHCKRTGKTCVLVHPTKATAGESHNPKVP